MNATRLIVALVLLAALLAVIYRYESGRVRSRNAQGTTSAAERRRRRAEQRKNEPFGAGLPATLLSQRWNLLTTLRRRRQKATNRVDLRPRDHFHGVLPVFWSRRRRSTLQGEFLEVDAPVRGEVVPVVEVRPRCSLALVLASHGVGSVVIDRHSAIRDLGGAVRALGRTELA
jgi:hypothetical protein